MGYMFTVILTGRLTLNSDHEAWSKQSPAVNSDLVASYNPRTSRIASSYVKRMNLQELNRNISARVICTQSVNQEGRAREVVRPEADTVKEGLDNSGNVF